MGEVEIEIGKVARYAKQLDGYSSDLRQQKNRLESIAGQIGAGSNYRGIQQALSMIAGNIHVQQVQVEQYSGALEYIGKAYQRTETKIVATVGERK